MDVNLRSQSARLTLSLIIVSTSLMPRLSAQNLPAVSKSFNLVRDDLTVNEPIFVRFSVENELADPLTLNIGANENGCCGFFARLLRPDGRTEYAPSRRQNELIPNPIATVAAFSSYTQEILVNKWFKFDTPGRYVLDIENRTASSADAPPTYAPEGRIVIQLGSRNPDHLEQICSDLEQTWKGAPTDLKPTFRAAEILAYMNDPIAVPFLERLLASNRGAEPLAIRGLARIADDRAVSVLITYVNSADRSTRILSRQALSAIEEKTIDPVLQSRIHTALKQ